MDPKHTRENNDQCHPYRVVWVQHETDKHYVTYCKSKFIISMNQWLRTISNPYEALLEKVRNFLGVNLEGLPAT